MVSRIMASGDADVAANLEAPLYWEHGRPRPHSSASAALNIEDHVLRPYSRFALSAGEGARAPSNRSWERHHPLRNRIFPCGI
jgi:hypothetical protein